MRPQPSIARNGPQGRLATWISRLRIALPAILAGCGITQPKYVDHAEDAENSPCAQAALETFSGSMQTAVSTSCAISGCHLTTSVAGEALSADNAAKNRAQLLAYTGTTSDKLYNKISANGVSHSGGDKSGSMPKATIDAWLAKEAACN